MDTLARQRLSAIFRPPIATLTDEEQSKADFEDNRERLKALRLAREAEVSKKA